MIDNDILRESRERLVEEIRKELLGPGSEYSIPDAEHELIADLPEVRYSIGVLFPQRNLINADNDEISLKGDENEVDESEEELLIAENINFDDQYSENKKSYSGSMAEDTDVGSLDEDIGLSTQNMPSSMGFTFFIKGEVDNLIFDISFGTYRNALLEDCRLPFSPDNPDYFEVPSSLSHIVDYSKEMERLYLKTSVSYKDIRTIEQSDKSLERTMVDALYRLCNQLRKGYVREPHSVEVDLNFNSSKNYSERKNLDGKEIKLVVLRKKHPDDMTAVTAMLVNTDIGGYNGRNSILQPRIKISTIKNKDIAFKIYSNREYGKNNDFEEKSLELLYRDKKIYSTGHGVSADWEIDDEGKGSIWTEFVPIREVPQMDFQINNKSVNKNTLSMKFLSDLDKTDRIQKINCMKTLIKAYSDWIDEIEKQGNVLDEQYKISVARHIIDCRESCNRMYSGIKLLETNDFTYNSFMLANRAMFIQRIHSKFQKEDNYPDNILLQEKMEKLNYCDENDEDHKWRPFQLAFLFMSIKSIVDPDCEERDLVDLIWFPTGGGKTEAYLGLTAFTIFFRRLSHTRNYGGTTVIMRYTLRLLAAQQFSRASTLICACESIRKDCEKKSRYPSYPLGKEKITIGLWIGGTHTPNKNEDAVKLLNKLLKATAGDLRDTKEKNNRFQILKCPWCGTKLVQDLDSSGKHLIGKWGYLMKGKHFRIFCTQENCEFESELPIQIVDEELYNNPPTLLFGTVDKFAMLPWKNDAGGFFATSTHNRTPELIIQDELHLISGPLGTIIGLYETAIDTLCSSKGVKPKIIASTATIRRAKDQCSNLYNRDVRQFPSPGIDANDSFFAREADTSQKPGRLYVGLMPSGKTKAMMEVRAIAAILQRVYMMNIPYEIKDKFWTLAVYFNSLRDLGKCSTLVDDDVKDFIRRTAQRFGTRRGVRQIGSADELTSRISTSQLNETLEKLEQVEYSEINQAVKRYPINVLLATNMISVGVDVARLNVMLLIGQPKLTSEYIQASSRIGRTYPGIAFVLYDGAKSRDRSHYEQFRAYHESFYRFVEPTGVTPFSKPARDRALHAVMISLIRHQFGISQDTEAALFDKGNEAVNEINKCILKRISEINKRSEFHLTDESADIVEEMNEFWSDWHERAALSQDNNFLFGDKYITSIPPAGNKRLIKAYGNEGADPAKETLTSMRNVDKSVTAGMIIWGD